MRVAIDYRILAVGPYLMQRGMGRYTQQQLRAVLAADPTDEFVLVCNADDDDSLIDPVIAAAPNVSLARAPEDTQPHWGDDEGTELRLAESFQAWVSDLSVDLFHLTTPFHLVAPAMATFDACPLVATFYDLIPLRYPSAYLGLPSTRRGYIRALSLVMGATRWVAISEASRQDAVAHLGLPWDQIDVAYPVPDASFGVLGDEVVRDRLAGLRRRVPLPEHFVLSVSYPHHSKNLDALLRAYAALPLRTRLGHPLVLCCFLPPIELDLVQRRLAELDLAGDVVITGLVTDGELAALYNGASVVVHPSRYEGFGLPVIEAMQCGTPVITTTASSLPEVAGGAAVLVDPDDVAALTAAMARVLADHHLVADLVARGVDQSARFGAGQLATATLGCYRAALSTASMAAVPRRPRIAMWTPLPPQRSGVADHAAALLAGLADGADVEAFVDDQVAPVDRVLGRYPVHHRSAFARRHATDPFDVVVYQLGASLFHQFEYEPLLRWPGVVDLHDLHWSYARWAHLEPDAFRSELAELEGPEALAALDEAGRRWAVPGGGVGDASEEELWSVHPMLGGVVGAATAVVVHSEALAAEVEARYRDARPRLLPLATDDPHDGCTVADVENRRKALAHDRLLVGVFGIVHPAKHLEACVAAVAAHPHIALVVVGDALDPAYADGLAKQAADAGAADRVTITGHLPWPAFCASLLACDVVVNLRAPLLRQASATLAHALAAGRPVVVTDGPDARALPDACCRRVPAGDGEADALSVVLTNLAADPMERAAMGAAARAHHLEQAAPPAVAARYGELIEQLCGHAPRPGAGSRPERWDHVLRMVGLPE